LKFKIIDVKFLTFIYLSGASLRYAVCHYDAGKKEKSKRIKMQDDNPPKIESAYFVDFKKASMINWNDLGNF